MRRLAKAVLKATACAGRGLLAGCGPVTVWVELANADVPQVTQSADTFRQARQEARVLQYRAIGGRPRHALRHIDDLARQFIDGDLAFQRVLLLFPAVVRICIAACAGPRHPLRKGIDHHS